MERENRDGKGGNKTVYAGALAGGEDAPPADGGEGKEHGEVEREHGAHDGVEV